MLRVAVIGLGDISNVHLSAIQAVPNAKLIAICDTNEALMETWKGKGIALYTDFKQMIDKETLDCIHICLPHYLHYAVTKACVEKKVHVFLEKPLDKDLEQSKKLVELEERHQDIKICISLQNRYNDTFIKLQELVASGQYGKILGLKGLVTWSRPESYYTQKPWRGKMKYAGGGVLINQAIHTLDLMQLLGGDIETVRGSIEKLLDYDTDVEDTATASIHFSKGVKGLFFATIANADNSSVELQVLLEKGKLTIKDGVLTKVDTQGKEEKIIKDAPLPGGKTYYGPSHNKIIKHFYTCIENNGENYIHAREGFTTMELIDIIRNSSDKQIRLNWESDMVDPIKECGKSRN